MILLLVVSNTLQHSTSPEEPIIITLSLFFSFLNPWLNPLFIFSAIYQVQLRAQEKLDATILIVARKCWGNKDPFVVSFVLNLKSSA